ncbi:leucine-rich repeat domain-containing protein (plasmid) [Clostridium perfringens]|uniref:Putative internalin A n=1 Tax=Clostridium perfringens TaxID=1502 RepID=A0A140GQ22_CLOPF|nr:leucine-rich repeat domain-containing protein [Clostridium perfringens]AMN30631.1 putative internalin A [Clostridium perfringens]AMN30710.1 putative internalin A [Clostridium perfringens]
MKRKKLCLLMTTTTLFFNIVSPNLVFANENTIMKNSMDTFINENDSDIVNIPDKNLKRVLNKYLKQEESSDISVGQLRTIENLTTGAENISNISGLEYCTNLKFLNISNHREADKNKYNDIKDISVLKNLKKLEVLNMENNKISDLTPISNLENLIQIDASGNNINNISEISKLKNLTKLFLYDNNITDISAIKNLKNLKILSLSNNCISTLAPLKDLKQLQSLDASNNRITDLEPLKDLYKLSVLTLNNNEIESLMPLKNCSKIFSLELKNNRIKDISPLKELNNLFLIYLNGNMISNISTLLDKSVKAYIGNQTISVKNLKSNNSLKIDIPVDQKFPVKINNITNNGVFKNNSIEWKDYSKNDELLFEFKQDINDDERLILYNGTVIIK